MVQQEKRRSPRVEMVLGSIILLVYVPLFIRVLSASTANDDPGGSGARNLTMVLNVSHVGSTTAMLRWGGLHGPGNLTDVTYRLSLHYRHVQDEPWQYKNQLRFRGKTAYVLDDLDVQTYYRVCLWLQHDGVGNFTEHRSNRKICRQFVTKYALTRDGFLAIGVASLLGCMILLMIATCAVDVYFYTIKGNDREKDIVMVKASLIPYIDKNRCPCQDREKLQRKQSKKHKKPPPTGMYGLRGASIKR